MSGDIAVPSRPLRENADFQFCWNSVLAAPTATSDAQSICSRFWTSRHRARRSCRALGSSWQAHDGVPSLKVEEHELCRLNTVAISTSTMLSTTLRKRCADVVPSRAPATATTTPAIVGGGARPRRAHCCKAGCSHSALGFGQRRHQQRPLSRRPQMPGSPRPVAHCPWAPLLSMGSPRTVRHCCEVRFFSCDLAVRADVIVGAAFAEHVPWTWPV